MHNDTLGTFFQVSHGIGGEVCGYCGKNVPTAITYQELDLGDIDRSYTIAKNTSTFGIECGDYAKFHRQVAHIQTKMKAKEKDVSLNN